MKIQSLTYYSTRVIQRFLLCLVVGATAIHWMLLITITAIVGFKDQLVGAEVRNPDALSDTINTAINIQELTVLRWIIVAAAVTALLVFIKRYRSYDKPMIADSLTIIGFCMLSLALAETMVRAFVERLAS